MVPLVTTGALAALLARLGLRLPRSVERLLGLAAHAAGGGGGVAGSVGLVGEAARLISSGVGGGRGRGSGGSSSSTSTFVERGRDGTMHWERRRTVESDFLGGVGGGGGGWGDGLKGIAKMFS